MILCPRFMTVCGVETTAPLQLVLLSATMPSAASLAGWLGHLHQRRVWLLNTTYRVVPLEHAVLRESPHASPRRDSSACASDGPTSYDPYKLEVSVFLNAVNQWSPDAYTGWLRDREATADAADRSWQR